MEKKRENHLFVRNFPEGLRLAAKAAAAAQGIPLYRWLMHAVVERLARDKKEGRI